MSLRNKDHLRRLAEERIDTDPGIRKALETRDPEALVHELIVHQIELEIQNEELRGAQQDLLESRNRFITLYDFSPVGYMTLDRNGILLEANLTLARMLGAERGHLRNKPFSLYTDPAFHEAFYLHRRSVIEGNRPGTCELRLRKRDKETFFGKVISAPVEDEHGEITMLRSSLLDVTDEKAAREALDRTHAQLEAKAAELEAANAELSQYAYVVSHDLKAPIRAVRNYTNFLAEEIEPTLTAETRVYLDGIRQALSDADRLIADVLELSRIEQLSDATESVDIGRLLGGVVKELKPSPDMEIVLMDGWPRVETQPVLLKQILQNLITNAVKFNRSTPKRVEVGWTSAGGEGLEIYIRDNGIGIDPKFHERIFRVFDRLHTRQEYEGTGIGLSIVRKALSKLGGSIRMASAPGRGSTFWVTLPTGRTQAPEAGETG